MHRNVWGICGFFLLLAGFGCATPTQKPTAEKAMEIEKTGDVRQALQQWQIVRSISPSDETVLKKIADLKAQSDALADRHFKQGVSYYEKNSFRDARREFLLALYYNQDRKDALEYLKEKLTGVDFTQYEVKKGDTLKRIAEKVYGDQQKDFLIAHFNNLKGGQVIPNSTLRLPILEAVPSKQAPESTDTADDIYKEVKEVPFDTKEMLEQARTSLKARKYQEAASVSETVVNYDPANREAHDLINESYYQIGKTLIQKKKYDDALAMLGRVESNYKDARDSITFVKKQLAEIHYLAGVKYFVNEDLEKAIKEWQEALTLNPNHPKAKSDMEKAQSLIQRLKEIK